MVSNQIMIKLLSRIQLTWSPWRFLLEAWKNFILPLGDVHRPHSGSWGPWMAQLNHGVHYTRRPWKHSLHGSIPAVPHPTIQAQLLRSINCPFPVEHALDHAFDDNIYLHCTWIQRHRNSHIYSTKQITQIIIQPPWHKTTIQPSPKQSTVIKTLVIDTMKLWRSEVREFNCTLGQMCSPRSKDSSQQWGTKRRETSILLSN